MRIDCENGFYRLYPEGSNELLLLSTLYGSELVNSGDFYTFAYLRDLPTYSIEGLKYGDIVAQKTYAGRKEDVFLLNSTVYDLATGKIKDRLLITQDISSQAWEAQGGTWSFHGIPQAGSFLKNKRLKSFFGWLDLNLGQMSCERVIFYE